MGQITDLNGLGQLDLTPNPSPNGEGRITATDIPFFLADRKFYRLLKLEADKMRKTMTLSENKLWQALRNRNLKYKFRRQFIINIFIVDFCCFESKLIVEVDGKIHNFQSDRDSERTRILSSLGYGVIRFTNEQVENNIFEVLSRILKECGDLRVPSPSGEG